MIETGTNNHFRRAAETRSAPRRAGAGPCSTAERLAARSVFLGLRCAAALGFALAFLWPALPFDLLVRLFAAYCVLDGFLALEHGGIWGIPWDRAAGRVWPLLAGGAIDLAAAAAVYAVAETTPAVLIPAVLIDVMAGWAVAMACGFTALCIAVRGAPGDYLLLLCGIAAAVFGRALLSYSGGNAVVLATWIGLYVLTLGVIFLKLLLLQRRPALALKPFDCDI